MADYSTKLMTWGELGTAYPGTYSYTKDEPPVEEWDDFFNYNTVEDIQHLISLTNARIESSRGLAGGEPTSPISGELYHDEDADTISMWNATAAAWKDLAMASDLNAHKADTTNPHSVTAAQADAVAKAGDTMTGSLSISGADLSVTGPDDAAGTVTFAAGADTATTGTPSMLVDLAGSDLVDGLTSIWDSVNGYVPSAVVQGLDTHTADTANPHSVTIGQIGAASEGHLHDSRYYNVGQDLTGTNRVGGNGKFFDFNNSANWVELVDGVGARFDLVTGDTYVNNLSGGTWLSSLSLGDLTNVTATGEGSGNGFDADTVDGQHASAFAATTTLDITDDSSKTINTSGGSVGQLKKVVAPAPYKYNPITKVATLIANKDINKNYGTSESSDFQHIETGIIYPDGTEEVLWTGTSSNGYNLSNVDHTDMLDGQYYTLWECIDAGNNEWHLTTGVNDPTIKTIAP